MSSSIGRHSMKAENLFIHQADIDSNGSVERNGNSIVGNSDTRSSSSNSNIDNSKTMRVTLKLKNGKIIHKIALQRTQSGENSRHNIASKMIRNGNDSTESVYMDDKADDHNDDDHEKMVMTGQTKSPTNDTGNTLIDNDSTFNADINRQNVQDIDTIATINHDNGPFNETKIQFHRIKRKSGKAAGALGRPSKTAGDSSSKSTSRKKESK